MHSEFMNKIKNNTIKIGVIGLGYVGLPLCREFVRGGANVIGFDIDENKIQSLASKKTYIEHIPDSTIAEMVNSGIFSATSDFNQLSQPDALLLAVPTPLDEYRQPDLEYVIKSTEAVAKHLRKGQLVVLESTTYPGTTKEVMLPILEKHSGLKVGQDFFLAYSPEREDPGRKDFTTRTIPKVVGGIDENSTSAACALYSIAIDQPVSVTSCEAAEASKILENTYRCVNIALVNELKMLFDKMGIDVWEVIKAAKTKPFGFTAFYPGPGLGGHCIPIDPFYLSWKAKEYECPTRFIELAGEINVGMPEWVVTKTMEALNLRKKPMNGSKILLIGIAYKPNVDDDRESPSYKLWKLLEAHGAIVEYHDPHCPVIRPSREYSCYAGIESQPITADTLKKYDAVLISTDHEKVNYQLIVDESDLVIDTRNATVKCSNTENTVIKA